MWQQIKANQRKSVMLILAMGLVLVAMGYAIGEVFFGNAIAGIALAGIIWLVMNMIALFQGDNVFLAVSKAKKIKRNDYPQLFNIMEEMKIASGLTHVPDIYVIDDPAPNAFATGRNPSKSAIAVTSGLLKALNRDELQGVIAHEMGHIKNRDVMMVVIAGIMVGTIVLLADIALWSIILGGGRGGRRSSGGGGGGQAYIIILVVALLLAILAPIIARLLYFAMSRKREYLADASAALYTRYPEGLASALEKISSSSAVLASANRVTAPMYIINPMHKAGLKANDLSSTHPPVSERIRILRGMGGASFADYDKGYRQVHKGGRGGVIPSAALAGAGAVGLVGGGGAAAAVGAAGVGAPAVKPQREEKLERAREVSGLLEKLNNYTALACGCGTAFRVPPDFKAKEIKCPRCGMINPIPGK